MPADIQKLMQNKEAIVNAVRSKGPLLPIQIAKETNLSLLFASAYLSEIFNERKIKMSYMKVGSSPIYFLDGQEASLESFIQYLNHKEREAFTLLKNQKLLDDEKMEPAIRVALRAIKDFAIPVRIKIENESKLFWKYFLMSDDELRSLAQSSLAKKEEEPSEKEKQETLIKKPEEVVAEKEINVTGNYKQRDKLQENLEKPKTEMSESREIAAEVKRKKKEKVIGESKFVKETKEYLASKHIEIMSIIEEKRNALLAKVNLDTLFGKQEMYLVSKDKKKLSEEDLIVALQKAQEEKMPLLMLSFGELDKKALEYREIWRNILRFERISSSKSKL